MYSIVKDGKVLDFRYVRRETDTVFYVGHRYSKEGEDVGLLCVMVSARCEPPMDLSAGMMQRNSCCNQLAWRTHLEVD